MPRKMRWIDSNKQQPTDRVNNKPSKIDEYDMNYDGANNKSINSDLYQALSPIYHVSKLSGVFPARFVRQTSGRYQGRLSGIDSIYSLFLLVCLIIVGIWGFWHDLQNGWEHSIRLRSQNAVIVTSSDVGGVMTLTAVVVIGPILRWKQVQIIIEKLIDCDDKLGIVSPKKTRRHTILLSLSSLFCCILISCLDIYAWHYEAKLNKELSNESPINYLSLYFMYIIIIMMEVQYAIVTYNVGQRFSRLNTSLENMLKSSRTTNHFRKDLGLAGNLRDQQVTAYIRHTDLGNTRVFRKFKIVDSITTNDGKSLTDNISQLLTVHASLCDIVMLINTAYGMITLAITITCLIHLIITPYFLIMEADGRREPLFLIVQGLWCIFHTWRLLIIVQPTYSVTAQAKKTAVLVSQLLSANYDKKEDRKQLEIFSLQILHRPLEFSACGLFTLDRALVTSIAGAVTTYLVILLQFQKDDDTKGDFNNILKNAKQTLRNALTLYNLTAEKSGLN